MLLRLHCIRLTDEQKSQAPAADAVKDTTYVFNAAPNLTSPYVGESRPSLDEAWHDLLQSMIYWL